LVHIIFYNMLTYICVTVIIKELVNMCRKVQKI